MPDLVALPAAGGMAFVDALRAVWDDGDAVLPVDPRFPPPTVARLFDALRPTVVVDEHGDRTRRDDGVPVEPGDALVIPTSGSTGVPKGVIHTHDTVAASARATNGGVGTDPATDRWLCSLPLSHVAGLSVVTRALASGTPLEVLDGFDADAVEAAARNGATLTTLVPTALARIDPSLFRRIVVGGTFPPEELPPNCLVSYGMTETGSAIAYDGVPLDGVEVRIVDGEIHLRGDMLLRTYRDGRDPKDAEGWLATDDAGELVDGRLVVHGRRGDLIITGGENVWPIEVERVLDLHPAVAEVAVVGRPDPDWGRTVTAVVVAADPAEPPTLDALRGLAKDHLPAYAAPRALKVVDALPRTPLGKVARRELAGD